VAFETPVEGGRLMPTIAFAWVGCKVNRYEIQVISERLAPSGFDTVPFSQPADCYVVNTCSVTSDADLSSRNLIRRARRRSPEAKVVVTGCYAQLRPEDIRALGVDRVVSNRDKDKTPEVILELFGIEPRGSAEDLDLAISEMSSMTRALVKIQDGCDEQCAFCAIWLARGPVKSRASAMIVREINRLSKNGYKEAVLTGVHIGKYREDKLDLDGLLAKIFAETSIERVRLSSLNPTEIGDDLLALLANESRLCPHVHLSVQSGDDEMLRSMGRKYTAKRILAVTEELAACNSLMTIGADFIVGYPGETEANFENTYKLVEAAPFHHLHVFPYSDRPGTPASAMAGKVPHEIKERRAGRLRELGARKKKEHLRRFIGRPLRVLVEDRNYNINEPLTGLSENYLRVNFEGPTELKREIVEVVPIDVEGGKLTSIVNIDAIPIKRG
jgi:threonylcarbamoyladenosine tRNA methylthiotransferase MtaB